MGLPVAGWRKLSFPNGLPVAGRRKPSFPNGLPVVRISIQASSREFVGADFESIAPSEASFGSITALCALDFRVRNRDRIFGVVVARRSRRFR